jgi:hypothetical protein
LALLTANYTMNLAHIRFGHRFERMAFMAALTAYRSPAGLA